MTIKHFLIILFISSLLSLVNLNAQDSDRVTAKPKAGDGIINMLSRYNLPENDANINTFIELNQGKFTRDQGLIQDRVYILPIVIYKYNGRSIRSTIGNNDWDYAVSIQNYNDLLFKKGIKSNDYRNDKILWVPTVQLVDEMTEEIAEASHEKTIQKNIFPIFGKKYQKIDKLSNLLANKIFYIVSGHGGPDPGAIGYQAGHELHEEEYAYDVSLRLARKLLEHGAEVYIIVQDENDGIRDDKYLNNSDQEKYIGGIDIPRNQLTRLQVRADIINNLYHKNSSKTKDQYAIITHVDSRITNKMIDIFFYYNENSSEGKRLASTLLETLEHKYHKAQPGRGYHGSVTTRNLYMLRKTIPVSIYIELGNIQNDRDQKRIVEVNNRQAIANWLTDGIIKHFK